MALTMIVTNDVTARFRGFLASTMLEIAPTVYVSPHLNRGIRQRIWATLSEWHGSDPSGNILMVWRDLMQTGGIGIACLGLPPCELVDIDGLWITRKPG